MLFVLRVHQARFEFAVLLGNFVGGFFLVFHEADGLNSVRAERYSEEGTRSVAERTLPAGWPTMRSFAT